MQVRRDTIRTARPEQQLERPHIYRALELFRNSTAHFNDHVSANLDTFESKSRRITRRSCHRRYSPSGDSIQANTRRGAFRVNNCPSMARRSRHDESRPSPGRRHEGSQQKGGLGSACADAGGDGHARHRQPHFLCAVKARLRRCCCRKYTRHPRGASACEPRRMAACETVQHPSRLAQGSHLRVTTTFIAPSQNTAQFFP